MFNYDVKNGILKVTKEQEQQEADLLELDNNINNFINNKNIVGLDLSCLDLKEVPMNIYKWKNLRFLLLNNNNLTRFTNEKEREKPLKNLKNLEILDVSKNQIEKIPPYLPLKNLVALALDETTKTSRFYSMNFEYDESKWNFLKGSADENGRRTSNQIIVYKMGINDVPVERFKRFIGHDMGFSSLSRNKIGKQAKIIMEFFVRYDINKAEQVGYILWGQKFNTDVLKNMQNNLENNRKLI